MWPNLQETGDLVTFAEEILNGKPHFLWILPNAQVVGFRNGKSRKDYLVRGKLPIIEKSRRCKLLGKNLYWSAILQVLPRLLQPPHGKKLLKFRKTP